MCDEKKRPFPGNVDSLETTHLGQDAYFWMTDSRRTSCEKGASETQRVPCTQSAPTLLPPRDTPCRFLNNEAETSEGGVIAAAVNTSVNIEGGQFHYNIADEVSIINIFPSPTLCD